jgi:hypothetical protein
MCAWFPNTVKLQGWHATPPLPRCYSIVIVNVKRSISVIRNHRIPHRCGDSNPLYTGIVLLGLREMSAVPRVLSGVICEEATFCYWLLRSIQKVFSLDDTAITTTTVHSNRSSREMQRT